VVFAIVDLRSKSSGVITRETVDRSQSTASAPQPDVSPPNAVHPNAVQPDATLTTVVSPAATLRRETPVDERSRSRQVSRVAVDADALPDVRAAANDALMLLREHYPLVAGSLRATQTGPDASLQGIITTNLTLDIRVLNDGGGATQTFTIMSRGGGFTVDESAGQARERLRAALTRHLEAP
jgi:hypothetical protein